MVPRKISPAAEAARKPRARWAKCAHYSRLRLYLERGKLIPSTAEGRVGANMDVFTQRKNRRWQDNFSLARDCETKGLAPRSLDLGSAAIVRLLIQTMQSRRVPRAQPAPSLQITVSARSMHVEQRPHPGTEQALVGLHQRHVGHPRHVIADNPQGVGIGGVGFEH